MNTMRIKLIQFSFVLHLAYHTKASPGLWGNKNPWQQYQQKSQRLTQNTKLSSVGFGGAKPQIQTFIIIGNQKSKKAEVYNVKFECKQDGCTARPLQPQDLLWSSPINEGVSEVKPVTYNGKSAVLVSTNNGAVIYAYPSGSVLFKKEMESSFNLNLHAVEVLPDGNVLIGGSLQNGVFGVLYPDGNNVIQKKDDTTWEWGAPYAHGAVYHKGTKLLYAGGYLTMLVIKYESGENKRGVLKVIKTISMDPYYDEPNHKEDANNEDGIHDIYPVDGDPDSLFVTTGEHVFLFNVKDYSFKRHPNFYTIPSKHSQMNNVAVKDKGGVKAISKDATANVVLAKSAPWFKEVTGNYNEKGTVFIWSMPKKSSNNGFCYNPDYDLTDKCKINLNKLQPIYFYKARVFKHVKV